MTILKACSPPAGPRRVSGHIVSPSHRARLAAHAGVRRGGGADQLVGGHAERRRRAPGRWSRASRRLPASSRLSVDTSMLAGSATCCSVRPCSVRSSRRRRRTRASTPVLGCSGFACMATHVGRSPALQHHARRHGRDLGLHRGGRRSGRAERGPGARAGPAPHPRGRRRARRATARARHRRAARPGRPPARRASTRRATTSSPPTRPSRCAPGEVVDRARRARARLRARAGRRPRRAARRVLLATGMDYRHPDKPGIAERWGGSVFHCPFCHGWEVRDAAARRARPRRPTGVHRALAAAGVERRRDPADRRPGRARRRRGGRAARRPASRSTSGRSPSCAGQAPSSTSVAFADGSRAAARRAARAGPPAPA